MDEAIVKYYRRLIKAGFRNAGSYENPSIYLDTVSGRTRVCVGESSYMSIYIKVTEGVIDGIKYLCSCDPTANVAVEILCDLVTGKTLEAAAALTPDMFSQALDGPSQDLGKRAGALIEILNDGIKRYQAGVSGVCRLSRTLSTD